MMLHDGTLFLMILLAKILVLVVMSDKGKHWWQEDRIDGWVVVVADKDHATKDGWEGNVGVV